MNGAAGERQKWKSREKEGEQGKKIEENKEVRDSTLERLFRGASNRLCTTKQAQTNIHLTHSFVTLQTSFY